MKAGMSDPSPARAERHLCWIDWLRFLAAFTVVVDHTRAFNWVEHPYPNFSVQPIGWMVFVSLFSLGKQAVVVFFVLSGWLVGGHTIRKVRADTFDASAYAADRFTRIYVPLVPTLLYTAIIAQWSGAPAAPWSYLASLFSLQNIHPEVGAPPANGPLWTLVYEAWFYVLAGCAAVAIRSGSGRRQRVTGALGATVAVAVCCWLDGSYLICWLLGAAGFWLRDRLPPATLWRTAAGGLFVMAAGAALYQMDTNILPPAPRALADVLPLPSGAQMIVAVGALLLIASAVSMVPTTRTGRWIERAGTPLAAFSYSLYLTNYPTLWALEYYWGPVSADFAASSVLRAVAWLAICVGVALGMYVLFESRTPRVRRWLRGRLGDGPVRVEAIPRQPPLAVEA